MNNIQNFKTNISEILTKKQKYDEEYYNLMLTFVTKAYELVDLSKDLYQVEHTIKLNQISLKDYILNSKICRVLKNNNIDNYSIEYLKDFMIKYEEQNLSDITSYKLALELYEILEEIKNVEKTKIDFEINCIGSILENVKDIENFNKDKILELYNNLLQQVRLEYLGKGLIDSRIENYIILILNDIINYYLNEDKEIPLI